ncbi:hypothetical protein ACE1B6_18020 [Aerosakkonemataceae cyanobacterium BLCC-F154]|uniref:Uncharacterized protein n=1 Tax=Floridaenema fluviatile BLCC-F154 TaxID=3153640 RepID=A0ABV4YE79_9CYAN
MEPTEEQYLVLNALDTLALLRDYRYDEDTGIFIIITLSPVLPLAILRPNGEVTLIEPVSEL